MNFRLVGRVPNVLLHMAEQAEVLTKAMDTVERQDATIIGGSFAGLSQPCTSRGRGERFASSPFETDSTKMTTVSAVYAAGDIARPTHNITWACADGVTTAMDLHHSLVL